MSVSPRLSVAVVVICAAATSLTAAPSHEIGQLRSGDRIRYYVLYVPDSYQAQTPTPLVVSLHGFFEWPRHLQRMSGWSEHAEEHGFIVVYPRGTGSPLRWNTRASDDDPAAMQRDVELIADLIEALTAEHNIDRGRVYVNGLSNGAGMAHVVACELADRIAAIGGVAGAYPYPWDDCRPTRPVPVIAFHGTADPIVPYEGGATGRGGATRFASVASWARAWAARNGCAATPRKLARVGQVSAARYTDCDDAAEVDLHTVDEGGHTWPGGRPMPESITGTTSEDVSATELMWAFFQRVTAAATAAAATAATATR